MPSRQDSPPNEDHSRALMGRLQEPPHWPPSRVLREAKRSHKQSHVHTEIHTKYLLDTHWAAGGEGNRMGSRDWERERGLGMKLSPLIHKSIEKPWPWQWKMQVCRDASKNTFLKLRLRPYRSRDCHYVGAKALGGIVWINRNWREIFVQRKKIYFVRFVY